MSQINVVPYIDVMLVLLVIFMVTAPFISPTQVELPIVGKSSQAPLSPLEVMIQADGSLVLRDRALPGDEEHLAEAGLERAVQSRLKGQADRPVVISADKSVRYEVVMRVMDGLQRLGIGRVGLLVKPASEG
jgi:biopolymer transport protein TolR